ncbi:PLP-dependent aminotransferase family protein (plasmid) [Agrobacterium leguminum]|uniref:Transcriptional regulator, GntR family n=1 Tax=Agrobacterium deltaense NCPPB 1641 TaxID=1183425 RepID=A0A1S7U9T8_9HYPH|nr:MULTISPECIES: PLP-dependent aminotransferase family protein [Agrobacterium]WFS70033.1 PLP-dependent aminotransferase family protein [Agrobacterium leguminum]CVI63311.1 putative transcriptional regulator, GntR family [Agrobacterium deltaense NCPPB 1641]
MTRLALKSTHGIISPPSFCPWLMKTNDLTSRFVAAGRIPGLINIAGGLPALETFPSAELADLSRRVILDHPHECLGYGPTDGLPELRDAIAARFNSEDLHLRRENVLITASGTQSLDIIGKTLIEPGGIIAAQFPSYVGAMDAWRPREPHYRDVVFGNSEADLGASFAGAQFAYTVPNFSNPTGKLVDLSAREAIVDAAHRTGVWLVEDDPYGVLLYDGKPLPTLIELSARSSRGEVYDGRVIYMGSFSKELAPGLRIAWIIAAPEVIRALATAKQGTDLCSSGLNQRVGLAAMQDGLVERMRPGIVQLYRERRDALCAAMTEHLAEWFEWEVPVGGMFVWATARDTSIDTDHLVAKGMEAGVLVGPSSVFDPWGKNRHAIRLNFTLNSPEKLVEGVRRLAGAVRSMGEQP